jgi:hypothetical protein
MVALARVELISFRRALMGVEMSESRVERSSERVGIVSLIDVRPSRMEEGSVTFERKSREGMVT